MASPGLQLTVEAALQGLRHHNPKLVHLQNGDVSVPIASGVPIPEGARAKLTWRDVNEHLGCVALI